MATYTALTNLNGVTSPAESTVITGVADTRLRLVVYGMNDPDESCEILISTPAGTVPLADLRDTRETDTVILTAKCSTVNLDGSLDYVVKKSKTRNAVTVYRVT